MRIWDIEPEKLCRNHLLGEHRELHAIWSIIINNKKGYAHHPEVLRWKRKLKALYLRHEQLVVEMKKRKYIHQSPLDSTKASGEKIQKDVVDSIPKQIEILKDKQCNCKIKDN